MADRFSVKFSGGKELAAALKALPDELSHSFMIAALREAAEPTRERMSQLAPREPGKPDLADNIGISEASRIGDVGGGRWEQRHDEEHAVAVGPTKNFFYGLFLEYGTVKMRARPFMRPGFDGTALRALPILASALWKKIQGSRSISTSGRNL